jgi:hypothetical protein
MSARALVAVAEEHNSEQRARTVLAGLNLLR